MELQYKKNEKDERMLTVFAIVIIGIVLTLLFAILGFIIAVIIAAILFKRLDKKYSNIKTAPKRKG
jgi:uncharacterized protein YqhQ